ncbi:phage tail protein [Rhodopila sp.]|uniref:phage tail protein n=1 Tax=Rhodopila sp. TaxID=2480087 RepID=UPI002CA26C75|nr:phage tail protein [Rhodopila sp.]HVZ09328.1 phage tail protein [Rhodopila sp.]
MPIIQQGSINATSLIVPDLYVQIVPPQNLVLNGVPTNVLGVVGTASWGPVNEPTIVATMADYAGMFGPINARKYDMGTQVATAVQQGAQDFRCVRVSDGTDAAASASVTGTNVSFTAKYTGTLGNSIVINLAPSSKANAWLLTVTAPGFLPELFDGLTGNGAQFWQALAKAVNSGTSPQRGPSQLVVANAGGSTASPATFSITLGAGTPGSDGATNVSSRSLIGTDGTTRTGMYALRGQRCGLALLADCDDATTWTTQAEFSLQEGIYLILTTPAGDTIANAVATVGQVGLDCYAVKLMFGDWLWWSDSVNGIVRLVSPQGFAAGRLANLSPEQSSLNKQIYGIVGSQRSGAPSSGWNTAYSAAELGTLLAAGIDVICNPQPAGTFWGVRGGINTSSNLAIHGDNYTRLTNYIAATLAAGMGQYVGQVINQNLFRQIRATQLAFLSNMLQQGLLGTTDGSMPFSVICDASNNPPSRTSLGYVQSDAQVQYQSINERFIVNVEGGQTVQVSVQTLPSGQIN